MPTVTNDGKLIPIDQDKYRIACNCCLWVGPPMSGKTSALMTIPAIRHIFIAPGELGYTSIIEDDTTKLWVFEDAPPSKLWADFKKYVMEVISGKHGPCTSIAIDGLHKVYSLIMKANGWTVNTDPKEFTKYHDEFLTFVKMVNKSPIKYRMATVYDGVEALDPLERASKDNVGVFANLPGKMAKDIMGEYPFVINTVRTSNGGKEAYHWRLKTNGRVQAAGMHLPIHIKKAFPEFIEPDWANVEAILENNISVKEKVSPLSSLTVQKVR